MSRIEARKLKGFRDFLPHQAFQRQQITEHIRQKALDNGFLPIDTPAVEYADVLLGTGGETDKEVYKFMDHGDRDVGLRFDLTVPLARFVTENYAHLVFPFRKFQIGEVWRGEKPQKGRYRQFCQADFDIIGVDSLLADVEIIRCIYISLLELMPPNATFTMTLNHRPLLSAFLLRHFGEQLGTKEPEALIILDKWQKIGSAATAQMLSDLLGCELNFANDFLTKLQNLSPENKNCEWGEIADWLDSESIKSSGLERFQRSVEILQKICADPRGRIVPALHIARGLGYYTGIVFETSIDNLSGFGSISSGGRYDRLVSRFGKYELGGVGGSIGVDRLLAALEELKHTSALPIADVFIAIADETVLVYAYSIAEELKKDGVFRVEMTTQAHKLAHQFRYADKLKIPFVVTVGTDEQSSQSVSIKNLRTGVEQRSLPLVDLRKFLHSQSHR